MEPSRREILGMAAALGCLPLARWTVISPMSQVPQPLPRVANFENLAYGMFVHWGLYSQLGRGEWVKHMEGIPDAEYFKLMQTFTAKDFNPRELARTAKQAGMNYITHTTRHHDGFSLYDTRGLSKLDVTHTPAKRDLILAFCDACRREGIVPMLYCTTLDWSDPRFEKDWDGYQQYLRDSVELLCTRYGKIGGFWFDGNWSKPNADWQEAKLYAIIRKHQPDAIIINNTGIDAMGRKGNSEIDSVTFERGRPKPLDRTGAGKYVASEMCHTLNFHWGRANKDYNHLSPAHIIEEFAFARRAGANLLLNVGPEAQGKMPAYEAAAMARAGEWIAMAGGRDGVMYRGRPCGVTGEGDDFALKLGDELFLFITDLTLVGNSLVHSKGAKGSGPRKFTGVPGKYATARWVDNGESLKFEQNGDALTLQATGYPYGTNTVIRVARLSPQ